MSSIVLSLKLSHFPAYAFLEKQSHLRHLLPQELQHNQADGSLNPNLENLTLKEFLANAEKQIPGSSSNFAFQANKLLPNIDPSLFLGKWNDLSMSICLDNLLLRKILIEVMQVWDFKVFLELISFLEKEWLIDLPKMQNYLTKDRINSPGIFISQFISEMAILKNLKLVTFLQFFDSQRHLIERFEFFCIAKSTKVNRKLAHSPLAKGLRYLNSLQYLYNRQDLLILINFAKIAGGKNLVDDYLSKRTLNQLLLSLLLRKESIDHLNKVYNFVQKCNTDFPNKLILNPSQLQSNFTSTSLASYLNYPEFRNHLKELLSHLPIVEKSDLREIWSNFFHPFSLYLTVTVNQIVESLIVLEKDLRIKLIINVLRTYSGINFSLFLKSFRKLPGLQGNQSLIEMIHSLRNAIEEGKKIETTDDNSCVICLDLPRTHIAIGCGHYVYCKTCLEPRKTCVICRAEIREKVKVYFN